MNRTQLTQEPAMSRGESACAMLFSALVPWGTASAASPDAVAKSTFSTTRVSCHGLNNKGGKPVAKSLKVPDLTSAGVQSQSNEELSQPSPMAATCRRSRAAYRPLRWIR